MRSADYWAGDTLETKSLRNSDKCCQIKLKATIVYRCSKFRSRLRKKQILVTN